MNMLKSLDFLYFYLRAEFTANTLTISHTGGNEKSFLFIIDSGSHFKPSTLKTASLRDTNTSTIATGYYLVKYSIALCPSADPGTSQRHTPAPSL